MVRLTDHPAMTIAVDLGRKATKQTNKNNLILIFVSIKRALTGLENGNIQILLKF